MNNNHILDLTQRLSQALDQNYDVVNMDIVLSVIAALEGTTITKEQLEATRLAKFVNQLRRRTKNDHLARRAKSLLKKWREMVGIKQQQQPTSDVIGAVTAATTNDNAMSANNIHSHQQLQHRSQPTSPMTTLHMEALYHANTTAFTSATAVSPLTRSANLNVHNSNRRLELVEGHSGMHTPLAASSSAPPTVVPAVDVGKQPTSFANLLSGFCNDYHHSTATAELSGDTVSVAQISLRNKSKGNALNQRDLNNATETFIIDQSSNSNSVVSAPSVRPVRFAPVIIDIQDSNSGSNLIATNVNASTSLTTDAAPTTPNKALSSISSATTVIGKSPLSVSTAVSINTITPCKTKRAKKDKKRKERDNQNESNTGPQGLMVNLEESSSNLQQQQRQPPATVVEADEKYNPFIADDKSRLAYPRSNISEILSLSNSSLSSMFPMESASRDEHNKSNLSVNNNNRGSTTSTNTSDLTFAGKFKSQQGSALPLVTTNLNSYDLAGYNGSELQRQTASPHMTAKSTSGSFATQASSAKFTPSDGGCNSNDSTSNSHASHPDDTDMVNSQTNTLLLEANSRLKQDTSEHMNISQKTTESLQSQIIAPVSGASQPTAEPTVVSASAAMGVEKAAPRKRGRKKGSKGIDAVIAKELSLTPQMLMTSLGSGGKKVKTTKELYTEMQNRKLGIATNSPSPTLTNWPSNQQLTSRPASSCSDDADTDSGTLTSEQSRDSAALQRGQVKRTISTDSNSNSQLPIVSKSNDYKNTTTEAAVDDKKCPISTTAIEAQLRKLLKELPAVSTIAQIEEECSTDVVPCTCSIIEILPEVPSVDAQSIEDGDSDAQMPPAGGKTSVKIEFTEQIPIIPVTAMQQHESQAVQVAVNKLDETLKTADAAAPTPAPSKPKKSIFDLDFDDDDDPLHTFKAEAAAAGMKQETHASSVVMATASDGIVDQIIEYTTKIMPEAFDDEQQQKTQQLLLPPEQQLAVQSTIAVITPDVPMPIFPTYQVEEDPNCEAKQRFEIQIQKITKFHIEALHNCFIPNVNGNWDNANDISLAVKSDLNETTASGVAVYTVIDGSNVVPKFGSLVSERIRKDLSHVNFTKNFKPKKRTAAMEKLYNIPFLGVARQVQTLSEKRSKHKHKSCHKTKTEVKTAATELQKKYEENKTVRPESGINANSDDVQIERDVKTQSLVESKSEDVLAVDKENVSQEAIDANNELYVYDLQTSKSAAAVGANNNIVMLEDITIDVTNTHDVSPLILQHQGETDSDLNGQNLLAIADNLNYAKYALTNSAVPVTSKAPCAANGESAILGKGSDVTSEEKGHFNTTNETEAMCESKERVTQNDGSSSHLANKNNVQTHISTDSISPTTVAAQTGAIKTDDNNSSRSSTCSSSSLKQTQQSINLKLRRQFQDQMLLERNGGRKRKRKKFWQRQSYTESDDDGVSGDGSTLEDDGVEGERCKKQAKRIKRIKIAINGDVATQMQFSMGSSNNSSDENNEDSEDADNDEQVTDSNNDDVESCTSGGGRHSPYDYNIVNDDADIKYAPDYENEDPEPEDDEYADADIDEDCDEDYSGVYHEVVTRDLSAPSTGNNHIVLTIKKTPSKTNSPSNSLTAMSPVISTAASNNSAIASVTPVPIINLDDADDSLLADDCVIVIDDDVTSSDRDTPVTPSAIVEPEVQIEIIGDETAEGKTLRKHIECGSVSPINSVADFGDAFDDMSMTASQASKPKRRRRKRQRRPMQKQDEAQCNYGARKPKLHQELFFPYELCIRSGNRNKCILNISSCSSSCASEDSDYEYYTSDEMNSDFDVISEPKTINTDPVAVASVTETKSLSQLSVNGHSTTVDESKEYEPHNSSMVSSPCSTYCSSVYNSPHRTALERVTENSEKQHDPITVLDAPIVKNNSSQNDQCISSHMEYAENNSSGIKAASNDNANDSDGNAADKVASNGNNTIWYDTEVELPLENNGLLPSFNNIYYTVEPNEPTIASKATIGLKNEFSNASGVDNFDGLGYIEHKQQQQNQHQLPNENCDDYNNLYNNNNNNFNLIKYASNTRSLENHVSCSFSCKKSDDIEHQDTLGQQKLRNDITDITGNDDNGIVKVEEEVDIDARANEKLRKLPDKQQQKDIAIVTKKTPAAAILVPHKEYRTGLRAVDEDVDDEEGNNCARIQQFKEWHQVLQLRSYNDELLTVLPYVVLE